MPEPTVDYSRMSKDQQGKAASWLAKIYGFRILLLTFAAAVVMAQPIFLIVYKDNDSIRAAEALKVEKQSDSAFALAKAAISEVTQLSAQYGEVKTENEMLRRQFEDLSKKYVDLMQKYKELESSYYKALEEKKLLEARIDELFRKHVLQDLGDKSPKTPTIESEKK